MKKILITGILLATISMSANARTKWAIEIFEGDEIENINTSSFSRDINAFGQSIAHIKTKDGFRHAAFIDGAEIIDLGTLGGKNSDARAINNFGQVVGFSETPDGNYHAFLADTNSGINMTDLGALDRTGSMAFDINDHGQIVGFTAEDLIPGYSTIRPFVTGPNGENMVDLNAITISIPEFIPDMYINNSGTIIINLAAHCDGCVHSVLYENGTITEINDLLATFDVGFKWGVPIVTGINDNGQILGIEEFTGFYGGINRAFLLTPISPVPEPATYAMLLAGLGLIGYSMRRSAINTL